MKKEKNFKYIKSEVESVFKSNRKKPYNYKQIASALDITSSEGKNHVIKALKILEKEGYVEEILPGKFLLVSRIEFTTGKLEITQRGTGYVADETDADDILVSSDNLNTALNGDIVKVNVFGINKDGKREGEIIEILERKRDSYVGTIQLGHNYAWVIPDDKRFRNKIFISGNNLLKSKNGDKVLVKVLDWHDIKQGITGEVIEILGKPGEHNTEMHAIIAEFGFANSFPKDVEQDAEKITVKISKNEIKNRKDFRDTLTFTIDPEDAKDFDDAISFKEIEKGVYEIGVHIADVSHYVTSNSKIDNEAYERGTSVYLVDRTIPMLPEKLSNGVCSLRPNEDKLTFSTVFTMNTEGVVLNKWIGKTIINSNRRFTYEEAQERIENKTGDFFEEINILNSIAKILKEKRFKNGAVNFETEEVKFKLDENYKPIGIVKKIRKDAHKLIEEFMLLSNKCVAEYIKTLTDKKNSTKTFVYRVHEPPSEEKLKLFNLFASRFGLSIQTTSQKSISSSFNNLLSEVEGKPEQNIIQSMAVRSMMKAYYSTKKTSHYGLAFDYYTHFTSPIRRYPDLMAHRLLYAYLNNEKSADAVAYEEKCKHSSQMEIQAAEAERASIRYKQVEYIKDFIGNTFKGIISGVTEWGIYVEITEYKCEGMIRLTSLTDDFYDYDEINQWVIGRSTRKVYQLGDVVEVVVAQADLQKRQIDLNIASVITSRKPTPRKEKPNNKLRKKRRR